MTYRVLPPLFLATVCASPATAEAPAELKGHTALVYHLTFSPDGLLTICQHGNRRVIRVNPHGDITVLADRYEGERLNSPNDPVYRSDGTLFFPDPPFGLPRFYDDLALSLLTKSWILLAVGAALLAGYAVWRRSGVAPS